MPPLGTGPDRSHFPMPLPPTEQMLERELEAYFRSKVQKCLGGMSVKFVPVQRGIPDRIVILPMGRIRFVELKTHSGRTSALQEHWHGQARGLGAQVDVVVGKDGVDLWIRQVAVAAEPRSRRRRRTKAELQRDAQIQAEAEIAAAVDLLDQVS